MKLLSLCLLAASLFCSVCPAQESGGNQTSQPTDPIVGRWRWFTDEFVFIKPDGSLVKHGQVQGKWHCVNENEWPRKYVLNWGNGMWIDTLFLKKDCSFLSGTNQQHHHVHGVRKPASDKSSDATNYAPAGSGSVLAIAPVSTAPLIVAPARPLVLPVRVVAPTNPNRFMQEHLSPPTSVVRGHRHMVPNQMVHPAVGQPMAARPSVR